VFGVVTDAIVGVGAGLEVFKHSTAVLFEGCRLAYLEADFGGSSAYRDTANTHVGVGAGIEVGDDNTAATRVRLV
jgi:hypothetical protein